MVITVNGDVNKLSPVDSDYHVFEWIPESPVTSKIIQLHIQEVGPYSGNAFGGIEAIQVFGCVASRNVQRRTSGWSNFNNNNNNNIPPPAPRSPPHPTYSPYTPLDPVTLRTPGESSSYVMYIVGALVTLMVVILIGFMVVY